MTSAGGRMRFTVAERLRLEVAYALPERQVIVKLDLPSGSTVRQAIEASGIRRQFPEIESEPVVGIFSRKVDLDHAVEEGDRVEIYRPLLADPKQVRREKAEQERAARKKSH